MQQVPVEKFVHGFVDYLSEESRKISDPARKFLAFMALGSVKSNPKPLIDTYEPMLKSVGIVSAEGMVDLDAMKEALECAFREVPSFKAMGFTFSEHDVDELYRYL